jgi:hypothetical protein
MSGPGKDVEEGTGHSMGPGGQGQNDHCSVSRGGWDPREQKELVLQGS